MRNEWQKKTLGEICDIERGGSPRPIQNFITCDPNGVNWIKIGDATASGKFIYETEEKIKPEGVKRSRMVYEGDFILSNSMSFGRPYIMKTSGCIHDGWLVLHKPKVDPDYLYYVLSSDLVFDQFDRLAAGSTVRNLNIGLAKSVEIPYPPLAAQRGPGWVDKKLSEVCAITSMLVDPRKPQFLDLTHVGAGNIESQTGVFVGLKTAKEEGLISGKFLFDETMVLYSKIRPYLMKVARPDFNGLCSADMYPLAPTAGQIDRDYLFHLLLSKHFTDYAIQGSARAGMPKVNREHLFEFKVSLPPVKRQKELASKLDDLHEETQRLATLYTRKLAALEALKKSLLHQAFTGELTKDWREPTIVAFPQIVEGITTTDLHAGLLAMAYRCHEMHGKQSGFGHVKGEKIIHLMEAFVGLELGRTPVKDAAGPNDFPHLLKVEHRARMADFFNFKRSDGSGAYRVTKLPKFDELVQRTGQALRERKAEVDRLLDLMVKLDWRQAEIVATVFAAWNNLLLDGESTSDEQIVTEARENWHPDKLDIEREKFFKAIVWMKEKGIAPVGRGKKVSARPV